MAGEDGQVWGVEDAEVVGVDRADGQVVDERAPALGLAGGVAAGTGHDQHAPRVVPGRPAVGNDQNPATYAQCI
ncbi:MAG TPA: hypothetical protein VGX23_32835 [Actinocrinis sp.]|nr:hypothetical protein [Actinocrinis sp.]